MVMERTHGFLCRRGAAGSPVLLILERSGSETAVQCQSGLKSEAPVNQTPLSLAFCLSQASWMSQKLEILWMPSARPGHTGRGSRPQFLSGPEQGNSQQRKPPRMSHQREESHGEENMNSKLQQLLPSHPQLRSIECLLCAKPCDRHMAQSISLQPLVHFLKEA